MASIIGVETLQHTNGTTAATIDSSGRIFQPAKPAILCMGNNHNNVSVGANTVLPPANYETSTNGFAQGGMSYDNTNGEITVPVDGLYSVSGQIYNNTNSGHGRLVIHVNGTLVGMGHMNAGMISTVFSQIILNLNANDKITFINTHATTLFMGNAHTYLQAYLIG